VLGNYQPKKTAKAYDKNLSFVGWIHWGCGGVELLLANIEQIPFD